MPTLCQVPVKKTQAHTAQANRDAEVFKEPPGNPSVFDNNKNGRSRVAVLVRSPRPGKHEGAAGVTAGVQTPATPVVGAAKATRNRNALSGSNLRVLRVQLRV